MQGALGYTGLVSILAILLYVWTITEVGRMRGRHRVKAPAMTGHEEFERAVRVQANMLEQMTPFLVALWLCALFWNGLVAAIVGAVWVAARLHYALAYWRAAEKRGPGFAVAFVCLLLLLLGALYGVLASLLA